MVADEDAQERQFERFATDAAKFSSIKIDECILMRQNYAENYHDDQVSLHTIFRCL